MQLHLLESRVPHRHTTVFWPLIFQPITYRKIAAHIARGALREAASLFVFGDLWHQHVIHNSTWFFEYVHREASLGETRLYLLSGAGRNNDGVTLMTKRRRLLMLTIWLHLTTRAASTFLSCDSYLRSTPSTCRLRQRRRQPFSRGLPRRVPASSAHPPDRGVDPRRGGDVAVELADGAPNP